MSDDQTKPKTPEEIKAIRMANISGHKFPPGVSGNPNGRPKGKTVAAEIRKLIADQEERGLDPVGGLAKLAMSKALKGDFRYFDYVREVIEGKRGDGNVGTQIQINIGQLKPPDGFEPPKAPVQVRNTAEVSENETV